MSMRISSRMPFQGWSACRPRWLGSVITNRPIAVWRSASAKGWKKCARRERPGDCTTVHDDCWRTAKWGGRARLQRVSRPAPAFRLRLAAIRRGQSRPRPHSRPTTRAAAGTNRNHIGYTSRRGDQGISAQGTRTFFAAGTKSGIQAKHADRLWLNSRPPERLNECTRYELGRFGSPRTPRSRKGTWAVKGERQLARYVHLYREGHRSRRLRGLSLR